MLMVYFKICQRQQLSVDGTLTISTYSGWDVDLLLILLDLAGKSISLEKSIGHLLTSTASVSHILQQRDSQSDQWDQTCSGIM